MSKKPLRVRDVALSLLERIEREHAFSHILLNHTLNEKPFHEKDKALLTELVYGTIKRKNTLDFYLSPFIKKGIHSLDSWVRQLLRLSVYQFVYLDRIPPRAVVHEAVTIAKVRGHVGVSKFVNGVLRTFLRESLPTTEKLEGVEKYAIEWSHPEWLLEEWIHDYGFDEAKKMAETNLFPAPVTVRVNQLQLTKEEAKRALEEEGCEVENGHLSPDALLIKKGKIPQTKTYETGAITIQDESSMLVARLLDPQPGMKVVDVCAAPGGKTTHIAERMEDKGEIYAFDLHQKKVQFIEEQRKRLHLTSIKTKALDARKLPDFYERCSFDRVLVDVPCSGFGIIRRKPEIKWQKKPSDLERLPDVQLEILEKASELVKKGGRLIYSTCTVRKIENEAVVRAFLERNHGFEWDEEAMKNLPTSLQPQVNQGEVTILPHHFETDGFFMAALRRM